VKPPTGKAVSERVARLPWPSGRIMAQRAWAIAPCGARRLRVIHPVDVLDSRIQNLHLLPGKRTAAGIAQARLAVDVAREFIRREVDTRGERVALKLLERVAEIAGDMAAVRVALLFDIDPLQAVPLEDFRTTSALHKVRWPQIVAEVTNKRESLRKLASTGARASR
jgi:hypothetical protein